MKRILVINIARMGDLILSSPLITGLKGNNSDCEISLMYSEHFGDVADAMSDVDHRIPLSMHQVISPLLNGGAGISKAYNQLKQITNDLRFRDFDQVINITHTHFSAVITSLIRSRSIIGMSLDTEGYKVVHGSWSNYYLNSCLNRSFNRFNQVDIHCRIGDVNPQGRLGLIISDEARINARRIINEHKKSGRKLIAIVPGASTPEKAWQVELFAQTMAEIEKSNPVSFLIFGAKSENELGQRLNQTNPQAINLCGKTDFQLLTALIEECDLMISNDTGPLHIAATVGTPVLDISLGSALSHETAPYGRGHLVIEPRIDCYPCHPKQRCTHRSCHQRIPPAAVAELAGMILDDRVPDSLPDNHLYKDVNVLRTSFDEHGWWELIPLVKRRLTAVDVYNQALREMWKSSLDERPAWKDEYAKTARIISEELSLRYISEPEHDGSLIDYSSLISLCELATEGMNAADELASAEQRNTDIHEIGRLGEKLKNIDLSLIRLAYGSPEVKPLVSQYIYDKENLTGWELFSLATQTAELHERLLGWGKALMEWINSISKGVLQEDMSAPPVLVTL
ncbi:MAG: glycosyltransferase family 9 protein [Calditrichaeota bacterium]|nr:glycosyltransferase family 9 protein [Calditrichota bacterium]